MNAHLRRDWKCGKDTDQILNVAWKKGQIQALYLKNEKVEVYFSIIHVECTLFRWTLSRQLVPIVK